MPSATSPNLFAVLFSNKLPALSSLSSTLLKPPIPNLRYPNPSLVVANVQIKDFKLKKEVSNNIKRKVVSMTQRAGAFKGQAATFALIPSIKLLEKEKLKDTKSQYQATIEFRLQLKNLLTGETLHEASKILKSIGDSKNTAIENAANSIKTSHQKYIDFIKEAQNKVMAYYHKDCDYILDEAEIAMEKEDYLKALVFYNSIPAKTNCYKEAGHLLQSAYKAYQHKNCEDLLATSSKAIAKEDYKKALRILVLIDSKSNCKTNADKKINAITDKLTEEDLTQLNFLKNCTEDSDALKEIRFYITQVVSKKYCAKAANNGIIIAE